MKEIDEAVNELEQGHAFNQSTRKTALAASKTMKWVEHLENLPVTNGGSYEDGRRNVLADIIEKFTSYLKELPDET